MLGIVSAHHLLSFFSYAIFFLADGLASNAPNITHLKSHDLRLILGVKPGDHKLFFNWVETSPKVQTHTHTTLEKKKVFTHHFSWLNKVSLNENNLDLEESNVMATMQAGRARWWIENVIPMKAYRFTFAGTISYQREGL